MAIQLRNRKRFLKSDVSHLNSRSSAYGMERLTGAAQASRHGGASDCHLDELALLGCCSPMSWLAVLVLRNAALTAPRTEMAAMSRKPRV